MKIYHSKANMTVPNILKKHEALRVKEGFIIPKANECRICKTMLVDAAQINKLIFDIKKSLKK